MLFLMPVQVLSEFFWKYSKQKSLHIKSSSFYTDHKIESFIVLVIIKNNIVYHGRKETVKCKCNKRVRETIKPKMWLLSVSLF